MASYLEGFWTASEVRRIWLAAAKKTASYLEGFGYTDILNGLGSRRIWLAAAKKTASYLSTDFMTKDKYHIQLLEAVIKVERG